MCVVILIEHRIIYGGLGGAEGGEWLRRLNSSNEVIYSNTLHHSLVDL
jgi:hypothetical protein